MATEVKVKAVATVENKMVVAAPNKGERCSICGAPTITVVRHIGGYTPAQLAAHAVAPPVLPERAANPESEEEAAARSAFYAAKAAADLANDAVAEAQRDPVPGGLTYAHGFWEEAPRDGQAERTKAGRIAGATATLREAIEVQKQAEAAWRQLQNERLSRTADWRAAQAAAAREKMVVKGKVSFAARLRTLLAG
jgi:hypothetical protein